MTGPDTASSPQQPDQRVPGYLGRILYTTGAPAGTCFQAAPGILVTAAHVLHEVAAGYKTATVRVDALSGGMPAFEAVVVEFDEVHDLAVLTSPVVLSDSVPGWGATDFVGVRTETVITGVSAVPDPRHDYRYLDAPGTWSGGTMRDDQVRLGRLESRSVMRGMSGGPVRRRADGYIVGIVSARYNAADGWGRDSVFVARVEDLEPLLSKFVKFEVVRSPASEERPPRLEVGIIPAPPMGGFVERAEILGKLAAMLDSSRVAVMCAALTGMRGVGKTHCAAAYAREATQYDLVGWIPAESPGDLVLGLAAVAERCECADPHGDSYESALRLGEHLARAQRRTLLVFDNATDPDEVRRWLPTSHLVDVVITSTDQNFTNIGERVEVGTFTRQQSIDFLIDRTGCRDRLHADLIADRVGDLALALASAAATVRSSAIDLREYLKRFDKYPLKRVLPRLPGAGYPHPTATALLMAVESIEAADPSGFSARLLETIAYLSPDGVRRDLLVGAARDLSAADDLAVEDGLQACVDRSTLTWSRSGEDVIMHRLTGRVIRDRAEAAGRGDTARRSAADLLERYLGAHGRHGGLDRDTTHRLVDNIEAFWSTAIEERDDEDGSTDKPGDRRDD
ncbi:serine protease [Nocardia sp. NPDC050712]|uniref:serine protease n=1 Tax=Nocardia sp. NPDC050712 TaxID=3155518 RepID=UPI0033E09374